MAQHMIGGLDAGSIVARNRSTAASVAVSTPVYATPGSYASISTLDTRLTAINATFYSQAQLDKMTPNDKVYAVRVNDDSNTI